MCHAEAFEPIKKTEAPLRFRSDFFAYFIPCKSDGICQPPLGLRLTGVA